MRRFLAAAQEAGIDEHLAQITANRGLLNGETHLARTATETSGMPHARSPLRGGRPPPRTAPPATAVRLPQELDYRLRGLGAEPTDQVPSR